MNIGDYVRLPDGIHKIKRYEYRPDYENCHCMYLDDNDYGLLFTNKDIIKSSPNIIDLIEVGDYVNGYKVLKIEKDYLFDYREEINVLIVQNDKVYEVAKKIYSDDIKSIVTKEQFSSMEYKIGDDK